MDLSEIHDRFYEAVGSVQITPVQDRHKRVIMVTKWVGIRPFTVFIEKKHALADAVTKMQGWLNKAYPQGYD